MAKVNFGTIANDARGKINGTVYSKNKSGSYVRRKVTPANPNTPSQSGVRSNFSILSKAWSGTLADSDRAAWIAYAATYPRLDIFGASITLSGLNMFISLNQVMLQLLNPFEVTPPPSNVVAPIPFDPASLVAVAATPIISFAQSDVSTNPTNKFYVFGSRPLPAGRTVQKNDFRFIGSFPQSAAPFPKVINVTASWAVKFGSFTAGQRIALLVATVDVDTGLTTIGTILQTLAT